MRAIISAAGTGGHINPGIAIANKIMEKEKDSEIIFIGTSLPGLGTENKIYINKIEKNISIWDNETQNFIPISNYTETIEGNEILSLFN